MSETLRDHESGRAGACTVRVQFIGDISLNNEFTEARHHEAIRTNLGEVAAFLGTCDLRIANFESPLRGDGGINALKSPRLSTSREAAACVLELGLNVALLANNHVYDCLEAGFENTLEFLQSNGIQTLGAGRTREEAARPLILPIGECRVGLLAYVAADTHPSIPDHAGVAVNLLDERQLIADVEALKRQTDVVLVNLHWGVDLVCYPPPDQRRLARRAIEAGAQIVAGHHAHRLQAHEAWREGHVFYGLGNFLFADSHPEAPWPDICRRSAVASCTLSGSRVSQARLIHFRQDRLTVRPDETPSRRRAEERLTRRLSLADRAYAAFWRRHYFYERLLAGSWRFLARSGGLFGALRGIRWRHVRKIVRLCTGRRTETA